MKSKDHEHSYIRVRGNKNLFMCKDPECKYYVKKELLEGKKGICPLCNEPFILDRTQLRNKTPRCQNCKRGRNNKVDKKLDNLLEGMGI